MMKKANNKVRFGIVGTGKIVTTVINAAREDSRFEVVAIYSRTQQTADDFATLHNIPYTFTSLEEMAASELVDAVYIASPNSLHASQSILCMNHGKHVLCEKPMASNARELETMIDAAQQNKVTLMEAMMPTLTPNFEVIQNNLKNIGVIRHYFASFCQYSSRYDNLKNGIVENAFKLELSNGATMDIGIYCIYPMVVLFGEPKSIKASGFKLSTGVDGQGTVNFEYDGMTATVLYSKISTSHLPVEIQGEVGTLMADRINIISDVNIRALGKESVSITAPLKNNIYYYEIAEFIDLVLTEKKESKVNSHENSLITMRVMDEIRKQLEVVYSADIC